MPKIFALDFDLRALVLCLGAGLTLCGVTACGITPTPAPPTPTPTVTPSATWTATLAPTATATLTPTSAPTSTRTNTPRAATPTRSRTPAATATAKPTAGPSPTPSAAQICTDLIARKQTGIFVVSLRPEPGLVWDKTPRQFQTGICNALPPANVPQGKYKIVLSFPGSNHGLTQSADVRAELKPGLNQVSIGPWIPGLENHLASCATRAVAETQVMYNDTPDPFYRALPWPDGSDRVSLAIQCGGNYP